MSVDPLGGTVNDNVCSVFDRANKVSTSAKGVVNDEGDPIVVCDLGDGLEIRNVVLGVTNTLNVDALGLAVDCLGKVRCLVALDKVGGDAHAREEDLELVVGASVEVGSGDDVVAGRAERQERHGLCRLARGGGHCCHTAL